MTVSTLKVEITKILSNSETPAETRIHSLLDIGIRELGQEIAIVSRIKRPKYEVLYSNNEELAGQVFDLGETYCSITLGLTSKKVLAVKHFAISEYFRHPAYTAFELETYIGTPIYVNEKQFGTLNFTRSEPREIVFSDKDKKTVTLLGQAIGKILAI